MLFSFLLLPWCFVTFILSCCYFVIAVLHTCIITAITIKQCFKGDPRWAGYARMLRWQGVTVPQGKLGPPGRLGDAFKTLPLSYFKVHFISGRLLIETLYLFHLCFISADLIMDVVTVDCCLICLGHLLVFFTWTLLFDRNGPGLGASLVCWHCCQLPLFFFFA
jgi:hypothetical protein